jgi:dipeptidyl aminopeptidase/acylaminoacyl peptidase
MTPKKCLVSIIVVVAWAWPSLSGGQVSRSLSRALPLGDALGLRFLGPYSPVVLSPDGTMLAYTIIDRQETRHFELDAWARTGVPWYGEGAQTCVLNLKTGVTKNVTSGDFSNWQPSWSPSGALLAFLSTRDGSGRAALWVWDVAKDKLRKISDVEARTDELAWSSDDSKIIIEVVPPGLSTEGYMRQVLPRSDLPAVANIEGGPTVRVYEANSGIPLASGAARSDPWSLNQMLRDLVLVDVHNGSTDTLVHGSRISAYRLSPDRAAIAYTIPKRFEKPGSQQILYDLAVVTISNRKQRIVASDVPFDDSGAAFSWSPDGRYLSFCSKRQGDKGYGCDIADVKKGSHSTQPSRQQEGTCAVGPGSRPLWDKNGETIYFVCDGALFDAAVRQNSLENARLVARIGKREIKQIVPYRSNLLWRIDDGQTTIVMTHDGEEKRDGFYGVDLESGQSRKLSEGSQCYSCVSQREQVQTSQDGTIAIYFAEDSQHPADLWMLRGSGIATRLTDLNPQFEKQELGKVRLVHWLSDDGERLQGALLLPAGYRENVRYPLLVFVYGGSQLSNNLNRFGLGYVGVFNMQLFATRGYAVLLPDSPQRVGAPMLDLVKTVLPGVNKVIEMGIADGSRLGLMGHSNGGYGTLALIVQTTRFKAAVVLDGTGDLLSFFGQMRKDGTAYGTSIVEHGQNALGGTPWEVRDRFIENSPFFYLDRIQTPVLLVHGSKDTAVAPFLADQIFVGLRRLGKQATYAEYEGEGHAPYYWSYANQMDLCQRVIQWFDLYLSERRS